MDRRFTRITMAVLVGALTLVSFGSAAKAALVELTPGNSLEFVTLGDLIDDTVEGVSVGDKIFTGFSYLRSGDMPMAGDINVAAVVDDNGNFGIRIQGGMKDLFDIEDPGNVSSDGLIGFDVHVADPTKYLISDVHLLGNPSLSVSGQSLNAFAEVVETVQGDFGEVQLRIQEDLNGLINKAWIDPLPYPVSWLHIEKDIQLFSIDDVRATLSFVDQTFSQVRVDTPEPTSFVLMMIAMAAFTGTRISRNRRSLQTEA